MRRLDKNYWRLGWVVLTNGGVSVLLLTSPIRAHHDQELLYKVMRTTPPPFSYWKELFGTPWTAALALILLLGIFVEMSRTVLSPVATAGPYVVWLTVVLWEQVRASTGGPPQELSLGVVLLLLIIPLAVVIGIDLLFYVVAFRRRQAETAV